MDIRTIQQRLKDLGLYNGSVDGKLGPMTTAAVVAFQTAAGLSVDGLAGPKTQAMLAQDKPIAPMPGRDIDPSKAEPASAKPIWPRQPQVPDFYGAVGSHQTTLMLPFPMRIAWDLGKTVTKFSVHEKVHDSAERAFHKIADAYSPELRASLGLDIWGGCLNVRKMRGGSNYSMHSWGIAIDFDPDRNQLKWGRDKARLARPDCETFWKIWEEEGWVNLGRARNFDWMHVQAARL